MPLAPLQELQLLAVSVNGLELETIDIHWPKVETACFSHRFSFWKGELLFYPETQQGKLWKPWGKWKHAADTSKLHGCLWWMSRLCEVKLRFCRRVSMYDQSVQTKSAVVTSSIQRSPFWVSSTIIFDIFDISYNPQLLGLPTSPGSRKAMMPRPISAQSQRSLGWKVVMLSMKVWEKPRNKDWSNCYIIGVN